MKYIPLPPGVAAAALQGFTDELSGESQLLQKKYAQTRCLNCGASCTGEINTHHAFSDPSVLVPRSLLRCQRCNLLFDPHTKLILEQPKVSGSG